MWETYIIKKAMTILERRLKKPGHAFHGSKDVGSYLRLQLSVLEHESFRVMFLNCQHELIKLEELSRGTIDSADVYPREVVKAALHFNAAAVVLTHNHPSGSSNPSEADRRITQHLKDALNLVDIRVLDHVIIGQMDSYSFAEHGLM